MPRAALGGEIEIPTLEGVVKKSLPAGTQTGRELRISGAGLPHLRGRGKGDLIARLRVWTPTRLSAKEKQLLEELGTLEAGKTPKPGKGFFEKVRDAFGG
jgi:molecular chaperone DnaJ